MTQRGTYQNAVQMTILVDASIHSLPKPSHFCKLNLTFSYNFMKTHIGVLQRGASIHSLPQPSPNATLQWSRTGYKAHTLCDPANHSLGRIMGSQGVGDGLKGVKWHENVLTTKTK